MDSKSLKLRSYSKEPKFSRRSMSPIEYMNTFEYKMKQRDKEMQVNFTFLPALNLPKSSIKRKTTAKCKEESENRYSEESGPPSIMESSFAKGTSDVSTFLISKSVDDIGGTPTSDSDILQAFDQDCSVLKAEVNLNYELQIARKKIVELQSLVQQKDRKICEQNSEIENYISEAEHWSQKAQVYKSDCELTNIKLSMEMRKNAQLLSEIGKLRSDKMKKKNILTRVNNSFQYRPNVSIFDLSPEKEGHKD